jgi:hypothetical protein
MPARFDAYRFRAGITKLSAEEFNARWRDIDARIGQLESISSTLESSITQLTDLGIERLEQTVIPVVESATQLIEDASTLLEAAGDPASSTDLDAQTGYSDSGEITYDGNQRPVGITEQIGDHERTTTITYNGAGMPATIVIDFRGVRRTVTLNYNGAGLPADTSATEEAI